jgi:hypothetical protein
MTATVNTDLSFQESKGQFHRRQEVVVPKLCHYFVLPRVLVTIDGVRIAE